MSKITALREAVLKGLGTRSHKQVLVFDGGDLTDDGHPWVRNFFTDADTGYIQIFVVSEGCFSDEYFSKVTNSIIVAALSHHRKSVNPEEETEVVKPSQVTKHRKVATKQAPKKVLPPKKGRPTKIPSRKVKRDTPPDRKLREKTVVPKKRGRPKKNPSEV